MNSTRVYFRDPGRALRMAKVETKDHAVAIKVVKSEPRIKTTGAVLAVVK